MAVNWALGIQQTNPYQSFQQGLELGRQRQRENYLMQLQRDQLGQQQEARDAQIRVGKHVGAGDLAGARLEAGQSGNLELVRAINQMSTDQRVQAAQQAQTLAPVYNRLRQLPYEQRRAELERIAPALAARGIPADAISTYDPTDQNLDSDISLGMTLEQQMERDQINWQVIPQVGAFATDYRGRPVNPSQMGGQTGTIPSAQPPAAAPAQAPAQTAPATVAADYGTAVGAVLSQAGVPAPVVAGILGNGEHESGGWNIGNPGDSGSAHGAFQWRGERVANFQQVTGAHPSQATPEQTAQFVLWEFQHPEAAGMTREQAQEILNAGTPEEAARLFSRYYERPSAQYAHNDRRVAAAQRYASQPVAGQQTAQAAPVAMPGQGQSLQDQAATGVIQAPRPSPPGYQWTPQGALQAIPGGPGDQGYQRTLDRTRESRENRQEFGSLQNQFRSDPDVRAWRQARTSVFQLRNLGQSGSPTDDIAMVFMFMKTVDPPSTVREGEQATVQNAAGVPNRIRNYYNQLMTGQRLTPEQRQDLIRTAERLYTDRSRTYNEIVESYRQQAIGIPGVERDQIGTAFQRAVAPDDADRRRQQRAAQNRPTVRVLRRRPAQ